MVQESMSAALRNSLPTLHQRIAGARPGGTGMFAASEKAAVRGRHSDEADFHEVRRGKRKLPNPLNRLINGL